MTKNPNQPESLTDAALELTQPQSVSAAQQEVDATDDHYQALKMKLPKGVDINQALDYGYFEHQHRYWFFRSGDKVEPVSNFTMKVLYLIVGANPKRIVEITNVFNKKAVIDLSIEDLISLDKFRFRVESLGNFLFEGKSTDLTRIKSHLLNLEKPSIEISRLGQYKTKFWAWANGLYDGQAFFPVDDRGMVDFNEEHYYIPVFGSTRTDDDEDLRNYRKFLHRESSVTFEQWSKLFCTVYGDNGRMGIAFFLFALFSDLIFDKTKAAPMLFLFGQRGSGKGTMAQSLMALYGHGQDPIMLGGASTVVGFMRKLGQFSNALVWLDEYKNDIGEKKIESLKNIWDRVGYERGVKDSSNRTQSTPVTSSAIISGQDMPNVEPALFSRTVLCEFRAMARTQEEVNEFNDLRTMEHGGITNVTLEVLGLRSRVEEEFEKNYTEVAKALRNAMADQDVIERQVINYAILVSLVQTLEKHIAFPFTSTELYTISEKYMMRQQSMMGTANEVQQFFEMVAYLLSIGLISDGKDIHIFQGLVKIREVSIVPLYREYGRRQGVRVLDRGTLKNYLANCPAYCDKESKQSSHRFPGLNSPTSCTVFLHGEIKRFYGVDFSEITQQIEPQTVTQITEEKPPF
jgi:energy-coupling factor transporter ATP-binding protein EcfA2